MHKKYDIFIVYRNKDMSIAHEILNWLGSDKDIAVGIYQTDKAFQKEQVDNILENSNNVVVLLSHDCFLTGKEDYKWFSYAIQRSVILNKAILPVNVNGGFTVDEKKKLSEEHIYVEQLLRNSELILDTKNDIYTGFDRIGLWHSVHKQSQNPVNQVFVDIQYGKTQAEKIFIQQLDNIGVEYDEPVDAKETGIEIGELIKGKSMYLYVMDGNNLRYSNISIAKANKIPYRYILLEENITWTNKLSQEEMPFLCRYYDNRDRNKLFASLTSHGCLKQDINIKTNQSNMNTQSNYDIYISYKTSCYDISKKIAASLQERGYSVFFDTKSIGTGTSFEVQMTQAIRNCKTFLIIISKDSFDNTLTWQNKEIRIAFEEKMVRKDFRILPIVLDANIEDIDYEKWPMLLRSIQCMTLNSGNLDEGIIQITNVLNQVDVPSHKPCEIFLAYPRIDKNTARKVSSILEKNGFSVWQDLEGINTCDEFAHVIMQAIDEAKVFLLIESKWSRNSEWVKRELEYAASKKKHIVKILTNNPDGLSGVRRMNFSPNLLEVGTKLFEEKLLAIVLSKGCNSDTSVISKEGERLYNEVNGGNINPIGVTQKKELENKSFSLFLRAVELGDENAQMYIDSKPWNINLIECVNQYNEIYSNFINDLREGIYNKGVIIAEDETLSDTSQRGRSMERAAFRFMKRAINLGYEGSKPEDYDWCYLDEDDFKLCSDELGQSSLFVTLSYAERKRHLVNSKTENYNVTLLKTEDKEKQTNHDLSNKIFISYKRLDKEIVFPIVEEIYKRTGIKCWIDLEGIESGDQFQNVIINAIDNADIVVFMLSKNFIAPYVDPVTGKVNLKKQTFPQKEIMYALGEDKRLVPVSIDGTTVFDCKWLKFNCSGLDSIDYSNEDQRNKFFRDVTSWLGVGITYHEGDISKELVKTNQKDQVNSIESFEDSVDLQLAWLEYDSENYKEALRQFLLVAKRGNANALNAIGLYYYEGKACKHNYQQALSYFQKAADMGYASAMRNVGDCYRMGHGVTKSMTNAIKWYQLAADRKNLKAIFLLAECLAKADPNKYHYYLEAAHMGHEEAIMIIEKAEELYRNGYKYLMDDRDNENIEKVAYCNLRQAAEYGHPDAYKKVYKENIWVIDTEKVWREFVNQTSIQ